MVKRVLSFIVNILCVKYKSDQAKIVVAIMPRRFCRHKVKIDTDL